MSVLSEEILITHMVYLGNGGTAVSDKRFPLDCAEDLVLVMWGRHRDTFHISFVYTLRGFRSCVFYDKVNAGYSWFVSHANILNSLAFSS